MVRTFGQKNQGACEGDRNLGQGLVAKEKLSKKGIVRQEGLYKLQVRNE